MELESLEASQFCGGGKTDKTDRCPQKSHERPFRELRIGPGILCISLKGRGPYLHRQPTR